MIQHIANPIYDIVFKYLLEDDRITKTILSALLKKEVVEVEVRKHEYTNGTRDNISIFRIDFGATIIDGEGNRKLILIELQKTWLETETLRFRQYLGTHYANPANLMPDSKEGYAIPMVTVYLLGHKVGDIEEPVLYVKRKSYDYDDNEVTKGMPDPFVESLTHDSIIVQIPRLKGSISNRLEKVLSVFDQTKKDKDNRQVLNIDEELYKDDEEMMLILRRLLSAASDAELRHDMNVEDEFFSAIEHRDTEILMRDKKLAEQNAQIAEQGAQLAEQNAQLAEQGAQLAEQGAQLAEQNAQLKNKDAQLKNKDAQLKNKDAQLAEQDAQLKKQDDMLKASVKMLLGAGVDKNVIAVTLNITLEEVDLLSKE